MDHPPFYPDLGTGPRQISVTEPISQAIDRVKHMLFPIRAGKWFTLGFVAWLAHLGEGGGQSFNIPDTSGRRGGGFQPIIDYVRDNFSLVVTIGVAVLVLGFAIGVLITWVSSRAKLMFVEAITKNEVKVEEPWRRFAERGKSLFWIRFWLGLIGLVVLALAVGIGGAIAWPDLSAASFGNAALTGALVGLGIILVGSLPLTLAGLLIEDFVVPSMVHHDLLVGAAWRRVKAEIFAGRGGTIALFYLMRFVLGILVGLTATVATCITCCIAGLPYIGTVILLPLVVFSRAYVLYFIDQFGPEWQLFRREPPPEWGPEFEPAG